MNQARSDSATGACCASKTGSTSETGCTKERRRLSLDASLPSENVSHPRLALRLRSLSSTFVVCSCVLCAFLTDLDWSLRFLLVYWTYDFALWFATLALFTGYFDFALCKTFTTCFVHLLDKCVCCVKGRCVHAEGGQWLSNCSKNTRLLQRT